MLPSLLTLPDFCAPLAAETAGDVGFEEEVLGLVGFPGGEEGFGSRIEEGFAVAWFPSWVSVPASAALPPLAPFWPAMVSCFL